MYYYGPAYYGYYPAYYYPARYYYRPFVPGLVVYLP
jgi:hypothetical protein